MWDETEHPRDEQGRFAKKDFANMSAAELKNTLLNQNKSSSSILVKLSLNFFAEKALESQGKRQIIKGINSKRKKIEIHRLKIKNPKSYYPDWDTFSEERKQREIYHWNKEIETHETEIAEREKILEERKEKNEEF